jgi:hypothetical protein
MLLQISVISGKIVLDAVVFPAPLHPPMMKIFDIRNTCPKQSGFSPKSRDFVLRLGEGLRIIWCARTGPNSL